MHGYSTCVYGYMYIQIAETAWYAIWESPIGLPIKSKEKNILHDTLLKKSVSSVWLAGKFKLSKTNFYA